MVDATISAAAGRMIGLLEEQARYHVNLVRGAEKEVCSLAKELKIIRNVLDDAENRRFNDQNINFWLSRLEQTSYQMEDVLDEWNYAILKLKLEEHHQSDDDVVDLPKKKVCSFIPSCSCLCFKKAVVRHDIAKKILNLKAQLDEILQEKDRYKFVDSQPATSLDPFPEPSRIQTTSFIDLEKVHGREGDRDFLVRKVLDDGVRQGGSSGIPILAIVGVGGLGKTTLAQQVYNDTRVEKCFDQRIWVCVSDPFDPAAVARGILENIDGRSPDAKQLQVLLKHVTESLVGKRFLLVLDDVWTEDYRNWEPFEDSFKSCGGGGSMILVTTRNERVAKMMGSRDSGICKPGLLSNEDCWSLLCRVALSERNKNEFKEIGMEIVKKCKGLPLAVKTLGGVLFFKKNLHEWENVLKSDLWEMREAEVELFPHLLLSYKELSPPILKRCFSYCAVFPKDFEIDVESLIRDWMALGYLGSDDKCEMEIDVLAMRSFFQDYRKDDMDEVKSCKMHDIVHDFAQFVRKKGSVAEMKRATCGVCDPLLVSKVSEFCRLDCGKAEYPSNSCDCFLCLRVLSLKRQSIPQGMVKLIHLRSLKLSGVSNISHGDLKNIFQLYHLQTLIFIDCNLDMIPEEIKNLIHLRYLELSENKSVDKLPKEIAELFNLRELQLSENKCLKELPAEIGKLIELRGLYLKGCESLKELPESISGFQDLQVLDVRECGKLCKFPEGLGQLTRLGSLKGKILKGGSGGNKLGILKKLNNLCGELELNIRLDDDLLDSGGIVEDAGEAELRNKRHLTKLTMHFEDLISDERSSNSVRMGVLDALHPHPNLQSLCIWEYKGSKLPKGLKELSLYDFPKLTSLPTLGTLPCLETLLVWGMSALERVGREFTGIEIEEEDENSIGVSNTNTIMPNLPPLAYFPNLKTLLFDDCPKWKEWEDIRAEEACMPCLTRLELWNCPALTALPHHLLRKATSLRIIKFYFSPNLEQRYRDKHGPHWKSISINNPNIVLEIN